MNIQNRIAVEADLPAITEIYNQAIESRIATADLTAVSIENRRIWLSTHDADYPVFVAEDEGFIKGWCSLSPYRSGRMALKQTAEISYYIHREFRGVGIGSNLIADVINHCPALGIKVLFAILLDTNSLSIGILEKFKFEKWGHLPGVADFEGDLCGHFYYGRRVDSHDMV
jgi:L-amino acid N-acyltransferase YncA